MKRLMSKGRYYKEAVRLGEVVQHWFTRSRDTDGSLMSTAQAEFNVHYGLALIYTGQTEEGISMLKGIIAEMEGGQQPEDVAWRGAPHSLEGRRRNWVLGRAHNNLGYTYWMDQGHYRLALAEFRAALPYFGVSCLWEEYANTMDNMGRVYTLLNMRNQAERLIDSALQLRRRLGRDYRIALSLISRAIAHLQFGELHQARQLSAEALSICQRLGRQRGIGLASITLGRALRQLGTHTGRHEHRKRLRFLSKAVECLDRAVFIFERFVCEPVRLSDSYRELGCTYREWAALARDGDLNPLLAERFDLCTVHCLRTAIVLAEGNNPLLHLDSCVELAETFFQSRRFDDTEFCLQCVEQAIPGKYRIKNDLRLYDVAVEECVEGFWYQMSKVELLHSHLAPERGTISGDGGISRDTLVKVMQHYAFANAYSKHYSQQATETNLFSSRSTFASSIAALATSSMREELLITVGEVSAPDPSDFADSLRIAQPCPGVRCK